MLFTLEVVSLPRRLYLMSGLGPTAEILSLRKPSLVFALRASLSAVQIRSRRICAWPKESIQRKGDPDAAFFLRAEAFERGCRKGLPAPSATRCIPASPLRAAHSVHPCTLPFGCCACKSAILPICPSKSSGARRDIREENPLGIKISMHDLRERHEFLQWNTLTIP
ncbi:hypothetical protein [Methylomonas albis]|nr:hypothetical protein [Methylomonas albis]